MPETTGLCNAIAAAAYTTSCRLEPAFAADVLPTNLPKQGADARQDDLTGRASGGAGDEAEQAGEGARG